MSDTLQWPLRGLPHVTQAGRFPLDDNGHRVTYRSTRTHALHLHDYHAAFRIEKQSLNLAPGDITLTPFGARSSYALPQPGHHWCIHFLPEKLGRSSRVAMPLHLALGIHATFAVERFRKIAGLFARGEKSADNPFAQTAASLLLQELLLWIADLHRSVPTTSKATVVPARIDPALDHLVSILHARFTEDLSVPALADEVELSQNYLARKFRQRFHTTIPHYLLARRIEHAAYLLVATNMPIHRIAQRVGMPDAQYFNKQFRRLTGQSPSAYRAQHHPSGCGLSHFQIRGETPAPEIPC